MPDYYFFSQFTGLYVFMIEDLQYVWTNPSVCLCVSLSLCAVARMCACAL